jgi:hypothetical protein
MFPSFNSQTVSRIVFLLFIIIISVYFMFINQRHDNERFTDGEITSDDTTTGKIEPVLPSDKNSITKVIIDIYANLYKGDLERSKASQKAIDFYYDYTTKRKVTKSDLQDIIESSALILEKSFNDGSSKIKTTKEVFGTEDDVIELYNEILFRNPDEAELYTFSKMLKQDAAFSIDKLKQLLFSSEEYKRFEKTQVNRVYSNLIGGVTDRQLTLIITTIYADVVGAEAIDSDLLKFLKKKLIELNLNEDMFTEFLKNYVKNKPFDQSKYTTSQESQSSKQSSKQTKNASEVSQEDLQKFKKDILQEVKNSFINAPKHEEVNQVQNPNKQVIEILLRTAKEDQKENYLESQNVLDKIKEQASSVFDKNATDNQYSKPSQDAAKLLDQRNTDELKNACVRNKKFLGVDENMVLDPSLKWTVPQRRPPVCTGGRNNYQPLVDQSSLIGTLLDESIVSDSIIGADKNPAI